MSQRTCCPHLSRSQESLIGRKEANYGTSRVCYGREARERCSCAVESIRRCCVSATRDGKEEAFEIYFLFRRFVLSQYRPDVLEMDINEAIEYIILACDGLWDVMSNEEVIDIVKQVGSPAAAAITIRDMAYQLGSSDNISVIVISLKSRIKSL